MRAWFAYRLRLWRTTSLFGAWTSACRSGRCGRPTVGYSVWCRSHTDAILFHGVSPEAGVETPLYESMTDEERSERWKAQCERAPVDPSQEGTKAP